MGWWQRLLSVRTNPETTFQSFEVGVRGVGPLIWTLAVMLLAGGVVAAFYLFEPRRIGWARRTAMIGLRTLGVGLLCTFIFRPISCNAVFEGERPRNVVLLIDNSQSMRQEDRRNEAGDRLRVAMAKNMIPLTTAVDNAQALEDLATPIPKSPRRIELVDDVLNHPELSLPGRLGEVGPLRSYLFGDRLERHLGDSFGDVLTAAEPRTALADVLQELLLKGDVDLPACVLVMTDGCDNDSKQSLARVAREYGKLGVPFHIYGVGSTEGGVLHLVDVHAPELLFPEDAAQVTVRWKAQGIKQGTVRIVALLDGKEVASKEVPATAGENLTETLTFVPEKEMTKVALKRLQVRIELKGDPGFRDEVERPVKVVDYKLKTLYIENLPRWEYKFLQRFLLRDRRIEAEFLLLEADDLARDSGPPYVPAFPASKNELFKYDLLILGDVKATDLGPARLGWIRDFVSEGKGLIHIAGRLHAPASLHGTPLEEVLPVEFRPVRFPRIAETRTEGYRPRLTRFGMRDESMLLADNPQDNLKVWQELPPLYWHYPVSGLRPGAMAMLEHPTERAGEQPRPLVAWRHYGKGRVVFVGFEETWRWRFNVQDEYQDRFWGQMIYRTGMQGLSDSPLTKVVLDRPRVYAGREGRVFARLLDANMQPLVRSSIPARLTRIDQPGGKGLSSGKAIEFHPVAGLEGEYQAFLTHDQPGKFALDVRGQEGATLEYRVELPPRHELARQGLAADSLAEAARLSGGAFYREEDLHRLVSNVTPRKTAYSERSTVPLLNPLSFLLFIALITAEWVLRKFSNLA